MEKSILVRRKAQKLAREGRTGEAIEHLRQLKSETDVDPYDHVFIGDLLLRQGHRDEAVEALLEAVDSYRRVGLNRSAIAICKKILRLGNPPMSVSRTLGDLYLSEGLHTEAVQHLLRYLDGVPADTTPPEEFYETLDKVASLSGLQVEAALRLSEHFQRVRREDRAAELLERLADQVGTPDLAQVLRERARHLCSAFSSRPASANNGEDLPGPASQESDLAGSDDGSHASADCGVGDSPDAFAEPTAPDTDPSSGEGQPPEPGPGSGPQDSLVLDIRLEDLIGKPETGEVAERSPGGSEAGAVDAPAAGEPDHEADGDEERREDPATASTAGSLETGGFEVEHFPAPPGDTPVGLPTVDEDDTDAAVIDLDGDGADAPILDLDDDSTVETVLDLDEDGAVETALDLDEDGAVEPVLDLDEDGAVEPVLDLDDDEESRQRLLEQAATAFEAGDWKQARACYERLHISDPLDREVLESLLAVNQRMQDRPGEVRCLIQLGDVWIAEEEYEKALEVFLTVIRLDPENATGRRRLIRFREMGVKGTERIPDDGSPVSGTCRESEHSAAETLPGVLETGSASVEVSSEPGKPTEEWVDLGALLDEFRSGVQKQIDGDDFQSHYDLAVSHRTMGLHKEAIEELDSMLGNDRLPASMAWICRELRGSCLADLGCHADAVGEFRGMIDLPVDDEQKRWSVLYNLARVLESAGEWREAEETYDRLTAEAPGFLDAEQRRRCCREQCDPDSQAA